MRKLVCIAALLGLGACTWIGETADRWGESMPVLPEEARCEHWQCIGPEGRAISERNKQERLAKEAAGSKELAPDVVEEKPEDFPYPQKRTYP